MARILGLDLGSHSVKGLLLDTNTRSPAVKAWVEVRRPEGERPESLRAALRELMARPELRNADQVVVALPGPALATHQLTLPFSDPKRIEATIPFEVESQIPFDLGEAVFDYQVASQAKDKGSELLVGVVRREELSAAPGPPGRGGDRPARGDPPGHHVPEPAACSGRRSSRAGTSDAVAIVDIGHERTTLAIGRPGMGVEYARTFSGGGRTSPARWPPSSRRRCPRLNSGRRRTGRWRARPRRRGRMASAPRPPSCAGLQPVLRELRPSFKSFTARTRRQVSALYVCGGTARMPGLAEQLGKDLGIPTKVLALPQEAADAVPPGEQPAVQQAYALALRGAVAGIKAPRFNLRRGEFSFKGDYDYLKDKVGLLVSFAATLLLLLIASGVVRNSMLKRRDTQVDNVLCDITQRILGSCEKDYEIAVNRLKGVESPTAALPRLTAVNLLAELTQRMPADIPVTFERIEIDLERIRLRVQTDSPKQLDTITAALKGHRCFKEVQAGKVEKTRDGTKVSFPLEIKVGCAEGQQSNEG